MQFITRLLSSAIGLLTDCSVEWIKNRLINLFIRIYKPDMNEAAESSASDYPTFNAFFSRPLRKGARLISAADFVSPADAKLNHSYKLYKGNIPSVKGKHYACHQLLGLPQNDPIVQKVSSGSFSLFYLSPKDYHRVHCPCVGTLKRMTFIPGKLLPVNDFCAERVPSLYAENQRAVFFLESQYGAVVLVMIAALFVSSIETLWSGRMAAQAKSNDFFPNVSLKKGEELGRFLMGSSVALLTESRELSLLAKQDSFIQQGAPLYSTKKKPLPLKK